MADTALLNTMNSCMILKMCMLAPVIQHMNAIIKMDPKGFFAIAMHCMFCMRSLRSASSLAGSFWTTTVLVLWSKPGGRRGTNALLFPRGASANFRQRLAVGAAEEDLLDMLLVFDWRVWSKRWTVKHLPTKKKRKPPNRTN